jgi:hypothetical protein
VTVIVEFDFDLDLFTFLTEWLKERSVVSIILPWVTTELTVVQNMTK